MRIFALIFLLLPALSVAGGVITSLLVGDSGFAPVHFDRDDILIHAAAYYFLCIIVVMLKLVGVRFRK